MVLGRSVGAPPPLKVSTLISTYEVDMGVQDRYGRECDYFERRDFLLLVRLAFSSFHTRSRSAEEE